VADPALACPQLRAAQGRGRAPAGNGPARQRAWLTRVAAPVAALAVNAFVWGLSWWPFRALQDDGVHALWSTALIYLVAFTGFVVAAPRGAAELLRTPGLWLLALAAGMTNVGFNWAVTIGDVVRVVLLFYLMPAWSVLLAWAVLGDRPVAAGLGRLLLALAGVATVLGHRPGPACPGHARWRSGWRWRAASASR
jgi:drug/metabolite transporter (DMT)-like permease